MLALGIDPATHSGVALVKLTGAVPFLLGCWPVYGTNWRLWCGRALDAAKEIHRLTQGDPLVGWYEMTPPIGKQIEGRRWDPRPMSERAGAILMALHCAGVNASLEGVQCSQWTAAVRIPPGKSGDGAHRILEAKARIRGAEALDRLEHCRVDCAEAALIAYGCALAEQGKGNFQMALPTRAA